MVKFVFGYNMGEKNLYFIGGLFDKPELVCGFGIEKTRGFRKCPTMSELREAVKKYAEGKNASPETEVIVYDDNFNVMDEGTLRSMEE